MDAKPDIFPDNHVPAVYASKGLVFLDTGRSTCRPGGVVDCSRVINLLWSQSRERRRYAAVGLAYSRLAVAF